MEKKHYYMVTWNTRTRFSDRRYFRVYETEAEAVKKARQVGKNPASTRVRVAKCESRYTPEPAPYGTYHGSILGYIAWQEN